MGPILSIKGPLVDESQVGLMDQRRALQSVPRTLTLQMVSGNIAEFFVDQRDQTFKGLLVSRLPA